MSKLLIIITLILLLGCTQEKAINESKDLLIKINVSSNDSLTVFFPEVRDGLTHKLITNASSIVNLTSNNGLITYLNNKTLIKNLGNGSYSLVLPKMINGEYELMIKWVYDNKSSIYYSIINVGEVN